MIKEYRIDFIKLIIDLFKLIIICIPALLTKIFIRDLWIIQETGDEARDNGYWLFKWIKENIHSQRVIYIINSDSQDFRKVSSIGDVVETFSLKHWFYYIVSNKKIVTVKGANPSLFIWYILEIILKIPNKRYFLQHGIIKDNMKNLYYSKCRYRLFVCGAKPEYDFVRQNFGYPDNAVQYLGLCRFDSLHDYIVNTHQILVMPTWRKYICSNYSINEFLETSYYNQWKKILTDENLVFLLKRTNTKIVFYPHKNMESFISLFHPMTKKNSNIIIASRDKFDIQILLKQSFLLITDFSSVFFDFFYMKKPVIFYQFDEYEFRKEHYQEGWFNYKNNVIGKCFSDKDDVIYEIEKYINSRQKYKQLVDISALFPIYDSYNCQRTYEAIAKDI